MSVAIIGSGVIGLTTGIELQKRGYEVTIYTKELPEEVNSNAACAIWLPFSGGPKTEVPQEEKKWVRQSWEEFKRVDNKMGSECGLEKVELIECIDDKSQEIPYFSDVVDRFETGTIKGPSGKINCWKMDTYVIEMPKYLPYLKEKFLEFDGKIVEKSVKYEDINELSETVVFNCAGIGAKQLFSDDELEPVKGEVMLHEQVDINKAIGDGKFCIIPRTDALVIGSQWEEGEGKRVHDEEWANKTLNEADEWATSPIGNELDLSDTYNPEKVYDYITGIRPERTQVRLEREEIKETAVYHNYGHGGSGVTLSWGCAIDIVNRFEKDILEGLNDINPNRGQENTVDISVEIAHSDTSPKDEDFDKIVSKSVERAIAASKRFDPSLTYNFVVLIDDEAVGVKRDLIKNRILESIGDDITVDYICYESELEDLLPEIKPILADETKKSIEGYIGNNGHIACSHDILIWYCLRLGLIDPDSNIIEAVSDRAKSGNTPFISDKNLCILREGVAKHERWAAEYLEESFSAEVVATAHNNIYYSID